ncbi:diguanylate cyclase domain-containing protein [Salinibacterium hongtaonis]|uniref:diguanylate cyclase domain-containing protein n=1 Tax=Homoserinimonas hongtaonis TaxID=2079791 RepID=UPI0011B2299D|nr:diguanylate cyclase [Salinibacterium hongtaonis]
MIPDHVGSAHPNAERTRWSWPFIVAPVALVLIYSLVFVAILSDQAMRERAELAMEQQATVETTVRGLETRLDSLGSDVLVAAAAPAVVQLADGRTEESLQQAAELFVAFVSKKHSIQELRYIDEQGREVLVVKKAEGGGIAPVPEHQLADWSDHYSFQDTRTLAVGDVYVSPLDLKVEDSEVVVPWHPTMRLATPVFDSEGARQGLVVIYVDGAQFLERFRESMSDSSLPIMLNADGGWLVAPDGLGEFGFALGDENGFATSRPEAWAAISAAETGEVSGPDGIYAYGTAHPSHVGVRLAGDETHGFNHAHDDLWKIVAWMPSAMLPSASIVRDTATFALYVAGLVVLLALGTYAAQMTVARLRVSRSEADTKLRLEAIQNTLGEGLFVMDTRGTITDVNPECARLLGWRREEMIGRDAHALFHAHPDTESTSAFCPMRAVATTGMTFRSNDEVFVRKDGCLIHVGVSAAPFTVNGGVTGAVVTFRDITEIRRYQEEIRQLAFVDELTGLPNRRVLNDRLEQAIAMADRHGNGLAVMFVDLDRFKSVNDIHGHEAGDAFLREIADRLSASVRASDTVVRQGGDEFVVLLPEVSDASEAEVVARAILAAFETPVTVLGIELDASVSLGIALYPEHGTDADALMAEADAAMYGSKEAGRTRFCVSGNEPVHPEPAQRGPVAAVH